MIDRRMVTDFALALLIAMPAILPAAPSPLSLDTPVGYPPAKSIGATGEASGAMADAASKWDLAQPERSS